MALSPDSCRIALRSLERQTSDPDRDYNAEDALAGAIFDELAECVASRIDVHDIMAMIEKPELQIDSVTVSANLPDVLRLVAERMDKARVARLAKPDTGSRAEWESKGRRPGR